MFTLRLGTQSITLHLTLLEAQAIVDKDDSQLRALRTILYDAVEALKGVAVHGNGVSTIE
jgi:hypothetical protein